VRLVVEVAGAHASATTDPGRMKHGRHRRGSIAMRNSGRG
jgi:hypothetical protein